MQNEKLKKFTDFFVKYRRYFCAAVLFVILVVILVKCNFWKHTFVSMVRFWQFR